jgi:hypothetical protein
MSDTIKARYVGHPDGIEDFRVPVGTEGEERRISLAHGQELPTEIDGLPVSAGFRDSLLEQKDNWARVRRETKTAAKADEKEA